MFFFFFLIVALLVTKFKCCSQTLIVLNVPLKTGGFLLPSEAFASTVCVIQYGSLCSAAAAAADNGHRLVVPSGHGIIPIYLHRCLIMKCHTHRHKGYFTGNKTSFFFHCQ